LNALDLAYLVALLLGFPFVLAKILMTARLRKGWGERLGRVPDLPPGHRIWVHCVSVGEVLLARTFIAQLHEAYPAADVVISTITETGRETARKHLPGHTVFHFPLDLSAVVRRVLRHIKPSAVVLVELEVWPNFLGQARRRGVPVVVVNGRITERSARRYRLLGPLARRMFGKVARFAVQNEEYAGRLERLGVPRDRICVAGTAKYDAVPTDLPAEVREGYERQLRLRPEDRVLLGGCTHPGEEALLIDYVKKRRASGPGPRLVLAPRHTERADEVERLIREAGLLPVRKSALDAGDAPEGFEGQPHVVLVDTTGELARLYALATVAFVGGSLVPHGGHNMIEPAALGKAVVFGPHTSNFRDTVELLSRADAAVALRGPDELPAALDALLDDPQRREALGARARRLIEQHQGATERHLEAVKPFLAGTTQD